ncbi:CaiB/BaiF CoA transferase family protein [Agrobacterium deltaense]|uniref:CaiB/BaiF CoA transferase family protein n=1 Tax=Agrobacterium deltaense TaxID=1183412 RepID=UPI003FD3D55E
MKLSGVCVLDLSQFMAGPLISAVMRDHGADVIKIESRNGDPTRHAGRIGDEESTFFASLNRGKRYVAVDLKAPQSRSALKKLVQAADVLVESFGPGTGRRLGLDYDTVKDWNPRLVYCSVSAFGQTGPLREVGSHDQLVQAIAGTYARGHDGSPIAPTVPIAGVVAAYSALSGILMALLAAREGRGGDHLDLSMFDATLTARPTALSHALSSLDAPQEFAFNVGIALLSTYRTADAKWLSLGAHEARYARALLQALDREDLVPHAITPGGDQSAVASFLRSVFASRTLDEWLEWTKDKRLSLGPVLNFAEALAHPHTEARSMLLRDKDGRPHLGTPLKFSADPGEPDLRLGRVGEDTLAVLKEIGIDENSLDELLRTEAIFAPDTPFIGAGNKTSLQEAPIHG